MDRCVVVIEDEPEVLELIRDVLELRGFRVVGVSKPADALRAAQDSPADLFLIDVMLPGISGVELAGQLQRQGAAQTPMIAMSASRLMTRLAVQSGVFTQTIDKPFEVFALLACVEHSLPDAPEWRDGEHVFFATS